MIMLTTSYLLPIFNCLTSDVRVLFNFDLSTIYANWASNNRPLNYIFFEHHPTVWTLGQIAPAHAKEMKARYNMVLGLNSMEQGG